MNRDTCWRLAAAIVALTTWGSRHARADDDHDDADAYESRTLAEHRFVPSTLVLWGFIDNDFAITSTGGFTRLHANDQDPSARMEATRTLKFLEIAEAFTGSAAVTPWLGLLARVTGDGVIPRTALSALVGGAHQSLGVGGGLEFRLARTSWLEITARGDADWAKVKDVVPSLLPDSPLLDGHTTNARASLIIALGISRAIGLRASGSLVWRWFDVGAKDTVETLSGAAALTLALTPIPLTLLLGGEIAHDYGLDLHTVPAQLLLTPGGTQVRGEGGFYYQGRTDLDLGAIFTYGHGDTDDARSRNITIHMRYYF